LRADAVRTVCVVRPVCIVAGRTLTRCIVVLQDNRIDCGIDGFGARDRNVEQLARARLALAYQFGEAGGVMGEIV
jgi:hypothetical protein